MAGREGEKEELVLFFKGKKKKCNLGAHIIIKRPSHSSSFIFSGATLNKKEKKAILSICDDEDVLPHRPIS